MEDSKMLNHKRFIQRGIVFIVLLVWLVGLTNKILMPKYYYNNLWPTTSTYVDFYEMKKNTVDILFLGSSHGMSSFSPQVLYDNFSLRSYNLSSPQQNLLVSYYWLKEALQYQSPQVVVLDTYFLWPYLSDEALNSSEEETRKALDFMRWSKNKIEAINDVTTIDKEQCKESYYFTNIRFHQRWKELTEDDFTFGEMEKHKGLKGYGALSGIWGGDEYSPFELGVTDGKTKMHPIMKEYLERIIQLCEQEEITLILTKTPALSVNIKNYNALAEYAEENEIIYIDYNEETIYQEAGVDMSIDSQDSGHLNIWGAEKVTYHIGNYLKNNLKVEAAVDEQWEASSEYYVQIKKNCELTQTTDMARYLESIDNERYTIFICIKDEGVNALNADLKNQLMSLGLTSDFDVENAYQKSYYAVIDQGEVSEQMSEQMLKTSGTIRKGRESYSITSAGFMAGSGCSIKISGVEYAKNERGFNIVVYDNELKKVVDSVAFDTYDVNLTAIR